MTHVASLFTENPFYNFTARADIPEGFNLNRPNKEAMKQIIRFLEIIRKKKRESVILPIIAEAGYGKTHLYWHLRETISDAYIVYIPVPTNPNRVYSHFYFETIKAGGASLLEFIADSLTQKYQKVEHAAVDYPGLGNIVIEGFFALKDPKRAKIALKWLTGFDLDEETTDFKRTIMDDEELAFAALKIILKTVDKPVILFVDELESLFIALGPEAELQFLETLKKMHNEASNFMICLACLATLWDKILDLSSTAVQSRIEPPVVLKRFSKKDIEDYCGQMLNDFHQKFEIELPKDSQTLWPLEKSDVESAYAYSHGNPREAIKWLGGIVEERKTPILKGLEKNRQFQGKLGKKVKKSVDKLSKFSIGVLSRWNGTLISLSRPELRILIAIPPLDGIESIFHQSYWKGLEKTCNKEEYSKIVLIGAKPKEIKFEDYPLKIISVEGIDKELYEYLKDME